MKPFSDREIDQLTSWLESREEFVFLETSYLDVDNCRSLLFVDPVKWIVCDNQEQVDSFFSEVELQQRQGYFLAGWFCYEFGCFLEPSLSALGKRSSGPLASLGVFKEPLVFDHQKHTKNLVNKITGESERLESGYSVDDLHTNISKAEYLEALERVKEYLKAGDTYQVNFTMKQMFRFDGSVASFYKALRRNQSVSYGAWIRKGGKDILSFSPELFFRADSGKVTVKPMKGTMSRGRTKAEDVVRRKALRGDVKNISENVMIVDLLRNDLGHLLHNTGGGVVKPRSLFDVEVYETLLQMTSTIDGIRTAKQCPDVHDLMQALFPCGSVTGAPKIRTMEIIHELEKDPRGVYCGAIGCFDSRGAVFNVPIRTVVLEDGNGEMGVGSGIVFDSDPDAEWEESLLKSEFLTRPSPLFQLIETFLWIPGSGYWLFKEHLERLRSSAEYFFFQYDEEKIKALLCGKEKGFLSAMRVRLLLCRDGSVEISSSELDGCHEFPGSKAKVESPLPIVMFSEQKTRPDNVHLFHKTTERKLYTEERQRALEKGFFEVVFINTKGEVTEGGITNIFIEKAGRLLTPPVESGLLCGTFRRYLLEKGDAEECVLDKKDVLEAEKVFVGNSVRGLIQVRVSDR